MGAERKKRPQKVAYSKAGDSAGELESQDRKEGEDSLLAFQVSAASRSLGRVCLQC